MKRKKCNMGMEYKCPHLESCESGFGSLEYSSITPNSLWFLAKNLTKNHKLWIYNNQLYSCLPNKSPREKTFLEKEGALVKGL